MSNFNFNYRILKSCIPDFPVSSETIPAVKLWRYAKQKGITIEMAKGNLVIRNTHLKIILEAERD